MSGLFFRLMLKAMVPLVIVLGALAYFAYLQGKDPLQMLALPFGDGGSATISKAPTSPTGLRSGDSLNTVGSTSTVYRWRDAEGNLHFSDSPPPGASQVDSLEIDPDANLILGMAPAKSTQAPDASPTLPAVNIYSPERIKQLFQQAEQAKVQINQRYREQDKLLEEIGSR